MHSTNYYDGFITIAPDSGATAGEVPPTKRGPTVASMSYAMVAEAPYRHTSDDVLFEVWADRKEIASEDREAARATFFSKGQPCMRASPLTRRYGWGVHSDSEGRVAVYGAETDEYAALAQGKAPSGEPLTVKAAMRSKRK